MKDFTFDFQRFSGDDTTIEITATTPHTFADANTYTIKIGNNTYEITCTAGTTISTNSSGDVIVDGGNVSSTSTDIPFALTSGGTGTFTFIGTTARTFKIDDKSYTITLNSGSTTISTNADGDVVVDGGNIKSVRDSEGKHVQFTLNNGIYTTNSDSSIDDSIIYLGDATNKVQFDARYSQNNSESYPAGETKVTVTKYTSNNTYGVTVLTNPDSKQTHQSVMLIGTGAYWYTGNSKGKSFDVTLDSDGYTYFNFSGEAPNGYNSLLASVQAKDFAFRFGNPFFIPTGSSPITLRYKDENLYLGNLSSGNNNFKAYSSLNNNATYITYTVGDGIVMATKSDSEVTKYWSTPGYYNDEVFNANTYVLWSDLNYDNSSANLTSLLSTTNEILTIAQTVLDYMKSNGQDSMFIVKDAIEIIDKGETLSVETIQNKTYGTLTRTGESSCEVKYSDNKLTLTGIEIEDGLTVKIAAHFTGIPIKYTAGTVASNFANLDSVNAYTVSSLDGGAISIGGSTAISLGNGSIRTAQEAQSIGAGNYSVSGYDPGAVGDGITVYKTNDTSEAYVGDIESLEAFNVGDKNYRKTSFGLLETSKESDYPYGTIYKIFNSSVSGDIIQESTYAIAVKLSALDDEDKKYRIIVPQESVGSSETINVLEIGGTNTINSVVYDSETNPQYAFAQITAGDNNSYLLETVSSTGTFSEAVNLISLSGGASSTSINSALTSGVQIYTSTSNNYAKFQVTATNADYVVVSSDTNRTPIISGASKITLPEGTIAPSTGQVVTVGSNEFSLTSTTATTGTLTIAYDGTTATVTAYPGDTFKFREKEFSVTAGDHITFTLTGNELTISNLNNNDAFTYNGYTYTVGSSSFVREKGSTIGLWSKDSRTVDSVTFTDMTTEGNWDSLVTISASTEDLTVPPTGFESSIRSAIVISKTGNTYGSTYGQIQLKDNGVYTLAKTTGDLGNLQSIIISGTSTSLSLGSSDFTAATYTANGSTFTLADDDTAGYQVTLSGSLAGVDGVSKATLTAGSLRAADSATTYYVNSKAVNSADEVVVIASGNGSISSVGVGEKFSVDSTPYTLTKVGFMKSGYVLRGNNSPDQNINSFNLGDVNGDWVSLAAASNVTINSASPELFIVNDTSNPSIIYAELATASGGHSLTAKTSWNTANKITIDTATVTMSGGFKGASIAGTSSAANFVAGNLSGSSFTVTDNNAINGGLLLSGLQNITLGAGLVAPSGLKTIVAANQTISNAQDMRLSSAKSPAFR